MSTVPNVTEPSALEEAAVDPAPLDSRARRGACSLRRLSRSEERS
jgi:hypothetical protein